MTKKSQERPAKRNLRDIISIALIAALCVLMAVLELVPVTYTKNEINNGLISDALPLVLGSAAVVWLMIRGGTGLFGRPERLLYLLPCLLVAVNNFPFHAYFSGKAYLVHTEAGNWLFFALYCLFVGLFEECVFRGILFPLLAGYFTADRKGFLKTYFLSSVIFGVMHLFNILMGAGVGPTLMQVGYSTLIGGLCAFALIKTKNILVPAFVHALFDFCGLLLSRLGSNWTDWQTAVSWAVVGVIVGAFVLYCVWKYPEAERVRLYERLGFGVRALPAEENKAGETKEATPENGVQNK